MQINVFPCAVADIAIPVPNRNDQDLVLDIAHQMERFVFTFSENSAPSGKPFPQTAIILKKWFS